MSKILFVDDDAIARRNIVNRIDWASYGWELIYTAKDGIDALEFMQDNRPDIILSDIQMPIVDGIQMAMIAKNYYPNIKFIFISGYKEFEYAKQALQLDAVDYLNKPIDNQQLIEVLQKAEKLYLEELKINNILNERYPLIKRQYISKLMRNNFKETDDSIFKTFDINLDTGLGVVAFLEYQHQEHLTPEELADKNKILCNMLSEKYNGSFFLPMDNFEVFIIYTNPDTIVKDAFLKSTHALEEDVNTYLTENLGTSGVFHYGSIMHKLTDFHQSYENALQEKNSEAYSLLADVKHYVEKSYSNPDLTLIQIADHFNINHCYLTSMYKEQFNINLYEYLIQVRMEKAAELLRTTTLKSYEIADLVGYNNSQYFSISFKKHFNATVTQYKNKQSL